MAAMTLGRADSALAVLQRAWEHVIDAGTARPATARRRRRRWGDACCGLAVVLALLVGSSGAQADNDATLAEYRIKAAFLLKFVGFIDWPAATFDRADAPFVIGVIGGTPLGSELERIAGGRQVNGHPVQVRLLGRGDSSSGSQVLFVGRAESARLSAVVAATEGVPMLLVSESDGALAQGTAINFVVVDDKVRFDVALRAINRAGLKISARLLAVARVVQPDPS
jgi:hypothetical protein